MGFSWLNPRRLVLRRNAADEAQGIGFVTPFLVCTGERQRLRGEGMRLLQATG